VATARTIVATARLRQVQQIDILRNVDAGRDGTCATAKPAPSAFRYDDGVPPGVSTFASRVGNKPCFARFVVNFNPPMQVNRAETIVGLANCWAYFTPHQGTPAHQDHWTINCGPDQATPDGPITKATLSTYAKIPGNVIP
jgi:hypothetical protein